MTQQPIQVQTYLVTQDLALRIVLEVPVALESALDKLAELLGEGLVVEEVVNTQTRARSLRGVRRTDTSLRGSNARTAEFHLLEAIDDLVEVEYEVCTVRHEEAPSAIQPCKSSWLERMSRLFLRDTYLAPQERLAQRRKRGRGRRHPIR